MHSHNHTHAHNHNSQKNIGVAFFLNIGFSILEIVGAIFTNSAAIFSDAIHDLGDSISLGLAWFLEIVAKKKPNKKYTYGFKRITLIGGILNLVVLLVGSAFILKTATERLFNPVEVSSSGMIWLAIIGVLVNGVAVLKLKGGKKFSEKVVTLHLLEDMLGWIIVLIGAIILYFTNWYIIDPILAIIITLFILRNVFKGFKSAIRIIMQGTPEGLDLHELSKEIENKYDEVLEMHHTRLWTIDGENHVMSTHLVVKNNMEIVELVKLKHLIKDYLADKGIVEVTIDIETEELCSNTHNHNS